jgi:MATE family multidrug resistance protein
MSPVREEVRAIARLAWPVAASQLGLMLFHLVDLWMLGRLGARELAAVALAETCLFGTLMIGIGLVHGLDPFVSQAHGAGRGEDVGRALQKGLVLSLFAAVPISIAWLNVDHILALTDQDPALATLGQSYATPQAWSVPFGLAFIALRGYVQGRGIMTPPLWAILSTNVLNAFLNWVLIFGKLGMPAMGVEGAGIATGISRAAMPIVLALLVFGRGQHRGAWTPWSRDALALGPLLAIGVPAALQLAFEVWAFNLSTQIAGKLGEETVAAHAIVLKLASFTFMMPLGIATAASTRVGNRIGAGDPQGAQRAAFVAFGLGAAVMGVAALAFVLLPGLLASIFTDTAPGGVLRGMGTPRPAAIFNLVGYYGLALPIGCSLAFRWGLGIRGVWIGLAVGLAAIAALLFVWIAYRGPAARASAISAVE